MDRYISAYTADHTIVPHFLLASSVLHDRMPTTMLLNHSRWNLYFYPSSQTLNLSAGVCGATDPRPVTEHTLFPIYDLGNVLTALLLHVHVREGMAPKGYETPLKSLLPAALAGHVPDNVRLKHFLSYATGLPTVRLGLGLGLGLELTLYGGGRAISGRAGEGELFVVRRIPNLLNPRTLIDGYMRIASL
jgi:hypothetical protein